MEAKRSCVTVCVVFKVKQASKHASKQSVIHCDLERRRGWIYRAYRNLLYGRWWVFIHPNV